MSGTAGYIFMVNNQTSFLPTNELDDTDLFEFTVSHLSCMLNFPKKKAFKNSVFAEWRDLDSSSRGVAGERLVRYIAEDIGYSVTKLKKHDAKGDFCINGHNVEVKTAMQKEDNGFIFNQIRLQDYEYIVCIVVLPNEVHIMTIPKLKFFHFCIPQHGGSTAKETFCYSSSSFTKLYQSFERYFGLARFIDFLR